MMMLKILCLCGLYELVCIILSQVAGCYRLLYILKYIYVYDYVYM